MGTVHGTKSCKVTNNVAILSLMTGMKLKVSERQLSVTVLVELLLVLRT